MHKFKKLFPQQLKNYYHLAQAILANVWYGFPSKKIRVIGITGTDGKTTTVQMVGKILEEAGKKVALASTINFSINGKEEKNLSHYTTESSFALQKFIRKAINADCQYLVLETSSHALDQYRTWGVEYDVAAITNVTREHLDYHKTMEKYRQAKKILFKNVAKNKGNLVVNLDMENPEDFLDFEADKKFGYTTAEISNFQFPCLPDRQAISNKIPMTNVEIINAEKIELEISGSVYKLKATSYKLNLPGLFNIENALAATCVALGEGINLQLVSNALSKIKGVAGRMEAIGNDLGVNILVDFALTPNALERLYKLLAQIKKPTAKIIAVFGSCGDRDKGKRPLMGQIVSQLADVVILTNDEPYSEEPQAIIDQIFAGVMAEGKIGDVDLKGSSNFQINLNDQISKSKKKMVEGENLWRIVDRRAAIARALSLAQKDDIICITGMGSFETMVVGDKKLPWNDRRVIEEELTKIQFGCIVSS